MARGRPPSRDRRSLSDGPAYGADEIYNAIRVALALSRRDDAEVKVFLMGDAVACAVKGQPTSDGYYTLDRTLRSFSRRGAVGCCGACMDARGHTKEHLVDEAPHSTMEELAVWTVEADEVPTF